MELEGLEVRALLSTIPAATQNGNLQNLSAMMANVGGTADAATNSSEVVVDPADPSKIVAVWDVNDTTMAAITDGGAVTDVEAAFTVDGGQTWQVLFSERSNTGGLPVDPQLLNPATSGPTVPYAYVTNPQVGFDDNNNFYILDEYSSGAAAGASATSGALVLQKFNFAGASPTAVEFTNNEQDPTLYAGFGFGGGSQSDLKVIYQWYASGSQDQVIDPTLSVDGNQATLPASVNSEPDPNSGNVYVSWTTVDIPVYQNPLGPNFNPYRIATVVSSDGGNDFGPMTVSDVNTGTGFWDINDEQGAANGPTSMRDFNPAMTVSQGREASESGLSGDPGIPGGQVTVTWDNAGSNTLMANTLSAGHDTSFGQQPDGIIRVSSTTDFQVPVNISNLTDLDSLDVRVDIEDPNDQYLGLTLIAPNGQSFILQDPGAITGNNEGVLTYTDNNIGDYELGTIFDDNATRIIGDKSETAPFVGDYVPDGDFGFGFGGAGTLDQFVKNLGSNVNGTWTLQTIDVNTSTSASPGTLLDWSLSFGRGLTPDNDVAINGSNGLVVPISTTGVPTTVLPASGAPVGPGVVMAVDNTLGPYSPYEGRIYAAFTGHAPVPGNPTTNTDIYLTYSDDGGRTWSAPIEVNDDDAQVDGESGGSENNPADTFTGRSQFQPALAVDPTTGTLVVSWRDARNDPNNTLVATYIASSIDGGNTFSTESWANPSLTATDAIDTQTQVNLGPEGDNGSSANAADATYGFGSSMGLAVYGGQVYPVWTGNLNEAAGGTALNSLSVYYQPMVIAAGPRIVDSTQGPIPYAEAQSGAVTFTVTFDRPINPPNAGALSTSFNIGDVQVFYHDTNSADSSIPLNVTNVQPVVSSGVGPDDRFGYTEFTVTFNPTQLASSTPGVSGGGSGITDFTGTYSYLVAPDYAGTPIVSPVAAIVVSTQTLPNTPTVASTQVPLPIPTSGTGGTGTADDLTISHITFNQNAYSNATITGLTVYLSLTHQNAADLYITVTAPDGQTGLVYQGTTTGPITLSNAPFVINPAQIAGGQVNGTYTLTIDDTQANNVGTLTGWAIQVSAQAPSPTPQPQLGAAMDQNADGITDENPMTMPDGYTGTTPGDVYAVPAPEPNGAVRFTTAQSILTPPFNQNTLPLIVPGPQVAYTQVVGASGQVSTGTDNLLLNDAATEYQVTFDRPIQTSSFTYAQVQSLIGPTGPISLVQSFPSSSPDQAIPGATTSGPGTLDSTIAIDSGGTLDIQDLSVSLSIASGSDAGLSAVLIAPNGTTQIPLFAAGDLSGSNLVNTVFDDSSGTPIADGTAPYTATFRPDYNATSTTLSDLVGQSADGTWTLQITNASGVASTLDTWSLSVTPMVVPVAPYTATVKGSTEELATTFNIPLPSLSLSGTYTMQLAPGIVSEFGDATDVTQSAGLNVLRGINQNGPTTTVRYTAADTPKTILPSVQTDPNTGQPIPGVVTSSIVVPDSFDISGDKTAAGQSVMQIQLNITYPDDPNLEATLSFTPLGAVQSLPAVILFDNVGQGTNTANFTNTVFDDNAATPIQNGSAPFFAVYNPQESLANVFAPATGMNVQGTWTLTVYNSSTSGTTGTINNWSLTFQKPLLSASTGLGEQGPTVSFQLSNLAQSDAQSSQSWTPVGGAASTDETGQVNAIAVDPSDPTGNTVYVGGASGGVWKTTDFLTTASGGPTWIPLTNFGPSAAINISSIAVFPRNDNPNQSIIIAATGGDISGEEDTDAPGVGFLISMDGGETWNLYDSTVNVSGSYTQTSGSGDLLPIDSPLRDRAFVGDTAYQVVVDPQLSPTGQVIIYAAMSGPTGGIWRSENTGQTWTQVLAGNATSVILDANSGIVLDPVTGTDVEGNLQIVYAGMTGANGDGAAPPSGSGVYMSTNQGQGWSLMAGNIGNPLIVDTTTDLNMNPGFPEPTPNGYGGKVVLAAPAFNSNAVQGAIYSGWLYAAVASSSGGFAGLYLTKDFGENWTEVGLFTLPPIDGYNQAVPTGSPTGSTTYAITDDNFGNQDLALTIDPTNPNITYLGGFGGDGYNSDTGLIRIDATKIADAHSLVAANDQAPGNSLTLSTGFGYTISNFVDEIPAWLVPPFDTPDPTPYLNFIRNPDDPFESNATLDVQDYASFWNTGAYVTWTPMDVPLTGQFNPPGGNDEISGTGYQILVAETDPTTGLPRLLAGNLTGIYSGLDDDGVFESTIGSSDVMPSIDRDGNLQLGQYYYAAAQPSAAAAISNDASLFYAGAQNIGGQGSAPGVDVLTTGDTTWDALQDGGTYYIASGTSVDQQGTGTLYQFWSPVWGGGDTNFVMVNGVGRTFNLLQASNGLPTPDPQWQPTSIANLVVDPVNGQDLLITSSTGNLFTSTDQGETWFDIGTPATFGNPGSPSLALAYGAPDPNAPEGIGNLGNFMYVGTSAGEAYVSQNAGGNWLNISLGLDGSPIKQIITDPARGSHDAYAVTTTGVFYLKDSILLAENPTSTKYEWVNITGGLKSLAYMIYGQSYNPATDTNPLPYDLATALNSIAANWNYQIPNDPDDLTQGYHPVLYVAANSGVYMSTDQGQTWALYPGTINGATAAGGDLPQTNISDLGLSQGDVDADTGMPGLAGPYQSFVFTGTLTAGSTTVAGITNTSGLVAGDLITGTGIPAGTTITGVDYTNYTLTLSSAATAGGSQSLSAANPVVSFAGTLAAGSTAVTGIASTSGLVVGALVAGPGIPAGTTITAVAPSFSFGGTLTAGNTTVTGLTGDLANLAVGDIVTGPDIPAGTTIVSIDEATATPSLVLSAAPTASATEPLTAHEAGTILLSSAATASGAQSLVASTVTADPDLLLAATYGEGAYAINLAPMVIGTPGIANADVGGNADGIPVVTTASPTIDGLSEITGFGDSTWVTIIDETPGDSTYGQVIGGFNPQQYLLGESITPSSAVNTTDVFGNFAIPITQAFNSNSAQFTGDLSAGSDVVSSVSSTTGLTVGEGITGTGIPAGTTIASINPVAGTITLSAAANAGGSQVNLIGGLKTVEVYVTDDAGSRSVPVTLSFLLNATDLSHPAPTQPPNVTLELTQPTPPYATIKDPTYGTISVTNNTSPMLDGLVDEGPTGSSISVTETWLNAPSNYTPQQTTQTFTLPSSDFTAAGAQDAFSFPFLDSFNGSTVTNGIFEVTVTASFNAPYNPPAIGTTTSTPVIFEINNTTPPSATAVRLNPADDFSGLVGDNVTVDRTPQFIGVTSPGYTVQLFVAGQPAAQNQTTAIPAFTGTLTQNSAVVTNLSGTTGLAIGQVISDLGTANGIPANATIVSINAAAGTLTLSAPATANATSESLEAMNLDANGQPYNFAIQLPYALSDGETSVYVEVTDLAGNVSGPSNPVASFTGVLTGGSNTVTGITSLTGLSVGDVVSGTGIPSGTTIVSINGTAGSIVLSADATAGGGQDLVASQPLNVSVVSLAANYYNGGTTTDPALFTRVSSSNQVQWLVQTPSTGFTGVLTSGSAVVTGITSTSGLSVGENVTGPGIPAGATIQLINSSTAITLSAAATAGGSQSLVAAVPTWFGSSGVLYTPSTGFTGVLTSGSAVVTGITSTKGLSVGDNVTGTGIPAGTTITAVNSSTSITLSATATAGGLESLVATVPSNEVVPFQGDFDGDGVSDLAYFNMATATWTFFDSSSYAVQGATTFSLGTPGASLPVVGQFDPNGPMEVGVLTTNSQGQDVMIIASSVTGTRTINFNVQAKPGDLPLAGDFDAIGYDEPAMYQASTGDFLVYNPITAQVETKVIPGIASSPDLSSLIPVPGQYDNQTYFKQADPSGQPELVYGTTEPAVYDPKTGVFTILGPSGAYTVSGFQPGDIPAPGDYLGTGSDQVVAYRPGTGQFIEGSATESPTTLATLGGTGDIPITAPLPYRLPNPTDSTSGGTNNGGGSNNGGSSNGSGSNNGGGSSNGSGSNNGGGSSNGSGSNNGGGSTNNGVGTTGGNGGSSSVSTTTPPSVTVTNVEMVTNKRHQVTEVLVNFSGAVNAAEAQDLAEYTLVMAGKGGSFTARNAKKIKLKSASYVAGEDTVILVPKKAFATTKKVQLQVNGLPPSGLQDSLGRPIAGDVTAVLSRSGASMAAPASAGTTSSVSAAVDALLELNALADVTPAGPGGRKRR